MLAQHALLIAISSDLNAYGVVCEFDWNDGNGQEGWPPMDGSEWIRITDIDTSGIFDSDDMTIKAAWARLYRIPITLHSRRFRYAIKQKEHPMQQFAIAGAASVRPFNPILSVQHSRKNILTGADFKQPRVKSLLDRLVEFLNQKVQPWKNQLTRNWKKPWKSLEEWLSPDALTLTTAAHFSTRIYARTSLR